MDSVSGSVTPITNRDGNNNESFETKWQHSGRAMKAGRIVHLRSTICAAIISNRSIYGIVDMHDTSFW